MVFNLQRYADRKKLERHLDRYRYGLCAEFAVALHKLTKWPLGAFYDTVKEDGDEYYGLAHAFVTHPSGKIADCYGLRDKSYVRSCAEAGLTSVIGVGEDHYITERPVTVNDLDGESAEGLDQQTIQEATQWILKNLARYGLR